MKKRQYFKWFDSLRAIAALVVLSSHAILIRNNYPHPLAKPINNWLPDAHLAVILFFVLSGFLISHILLNEYTTYKKINIKMFYIRRALRILPLYFLILFSSYLLIRPEVSSTSIVLNFSFFPNIANAIGHTWTASPQIWSIGVEEQFYLFFPLLIISLTTRKRLFIFSILFILILSFLPFALDISMANSPYLAYVKSFLHTSKYHCILIGSLSYILYSYLKKKALKIPLPLTTITIILPLILWFMSFELNYLNDEFYALLFGLMLFTITASSKLQSIKEFPPLKFLGKISYGIYMYHWLVIILLAKYIPILIHFPLAFYGLSIAFSILVAWISYQTFERYFMRLNEKQQS